MKSRGVGTRTAALLASVAGHAALVIALTVVTFVTQNEPERGEEGPTGWLESGWRQLAGRSGGPRGLGRDAMQAVLSAPDGTMIRLRSSTGGAAVGLACWSPSVGLWIAVDQMPPGTPRSLTVWLRAEDAHRRSLGRIELDASGSGRVIAVWNEPASLGDQVTLEVATSARLWPLTRSNVVLHGSTAP